MTMETSKMVGQNKSLLLRGKEGEKETGGRIGRKGGREGGEVNHWEGQGVTQQHSGLC